MIILLTNDHATLYLEYLILRSQKMDPILQAKIDELNAAVAEDTTVDGSAGTALDGLAALYAAAIKNATSDPAVLAALDAATAQIKANNANLAAKVVANTPAAA